MTERTTKPSVKRKNSHYEVELPQELAHLANRTGPVKLRVQVKKKPVAGFDDCAAQLKIREIFSGRDQKRGDRISSSLYVLYGKGNPLDASIGSLIEEMLLKGRLTSGGATTKPTTEPIRGPYVPHEYLRRGEDA